MSDLGIGGATVKNRHNTAIKLAERAGSKTLEAMSGDRLIEVGEAATAYAGGLKKLGLVQSACHSTFYG